MQRQRREPSPPPPSLWASVTPSSEAFAALDGDAETDALVVGGGITGLSAALHLKERGLDVILIDAVDPGFGASGRNNGQVIPNLTRAEPDAIIACFGEAGERFVHLLRDSADQLFDAIRKHGLAAEAEQTGWLQPVHTPGRMRIAERRVEQWARHGARVELLDRARVTALTGSEIWHGGHRNASGGHVNPLAVTRGLARLAERKGVRIHGATPAERYWREGTRWHVATPLGIIRSRALLLATNAYTGEIASSLAPDLAREVVPVRSWQMATAPLDEHHRARIIPGREALSDTHGDLYFARWDARGRLVTGGALIVATNGAERLRRRIGERLMRIFPSLGGVRFDFIWNGFVGMTTDFTPRFHQLGPDAWTWIGCNGRGLALGHALGDGLAQALTGAAPGDLPFPVTPLRALPAHALVRRLAPLRLIHYRWKDAREI